MPIPLNPTQSMVDAADDATVLAWFEELPAASFKRKTVAATSGKLKNINKGKAIKEWTINQKRDFLKAVFTDAFEGM